MPASDCGHYYPPYKHLIMGRWLIISFVCLCFGACRRQVDPTSTNNNDIAAYLKEHLSAQDFGQVDFSKLTISKAEDTYAKVGFIGKDFGRDFILLKYDDQVIIDGKIIEISLDDEVTVSTDGSITRYTLDRKEVEKQKIVNGFVTAFDGNASSRVASGPINLMPLLLQMHYREGPNLPFELVNYINIQRAYNNLPNGSHVYYYEATENKHETSDGGYRPPATITVTQDGDDHPPALDIQKIIDCFKTVADLGATCTVELYTDIPVDTDPNLYVNWQQLSPGHSFMRITKSNRGKFVSQDIGFYPQNSFKSILTDPVPGILVDDSKHEYNAAIKINVDFSRLASVFFYIKKFSLKSRYDIDDFNCSDFAVTVFNLARPEKRLVIPKYKVPGGETAEGTTTPQALYLELKRRKLYGTDRDNIEIPNSKGYTFPSYLPCK